MVATVAHGQMYVLLTCALTVCWLADRRGRPIAAGVALGLAIAIKPSLLPVLLLPLMRRQWTVLGSAVTAAAAASVVGVAAAGWSSLSSWFGLMANGTANPITNNASLPSAIVRMFSPNEVAAPLVELPGATLLGLALAIAVLAITAARIRHRPAPGVPDTALWATAAAALLASPIAWFHYLVLLAPAALVVAAAGRRPQALLLLALPLIGVEWFTMWPAEQPGSALPLSLWAGVLLLCWLALLPGGSAPEPARPQPQPWALTESR
jgi:hypothetical protein